MTAAAAERIAAITKLLGPDPVTTARQNQAWARDVKRGCSCPHAWRDGHWVRNGAATCRIHTIGQLLAEEVT